MFPDFKYMMQAGGQDLRKRGRSTLSKTLALQGAANARNSYDIIGDIAIIRLHNVQGESKRIAQATMGIHKNVKAVFAQTSAVCGDFRVRPLEYVAGERKTTTRHRESGCLFS